MAPGGLRAASVGPRGDVEEVVMLGRATGLERVRGGVKRGVPSSRGLSRGEVADSSGEVGGEGESRGSDIVSVAGTGWGGDASRIVSKYLLQPVVAVKMGVTDQA
jgi:hypothetical protein